MTPCRDSEAHDDLMRRGPPLYLPVFARRMGLPTDKSNDFAILALADFKAEVDDANRANRS
jgi:hypothetical protein